MCRGHAEWKVSALSPLEIEQNEALESWSKANKAFVDTFIYTGPEWTLRVIWATALINNKNNKNFVGQSGNMFSVQPHE